MIHEEPKRKNWANIHPPAHPRQMLNLVQDEQKRKTVKKNDTIIKMCPYCSMMA